MRATYLFCYSNRFLPCHNVKRLQKTSSDRYVFFFLYSVYSEQKNKKEKRRYRKHQLDTRREVETGIGEGTFTEVSGECGECFKRMMFLLTKNCFSCGQRVESCHRCPWFDRQKNTFIHANSSPLLLNKTIDMSIVMPWHIYNSTSVYLFSCTRVIGSISMCFCVFFFHAKLRIFT